MNTRELLECLNNTKTVKELYRLRHTSITYPEIKENPIDWKERMKTKNSILKKHLIITAVILCGYLLVVFLPFYIAFPPIGSSILLAIPPMLFVSLSWMIAAWWAYDKDRNIFFAVTMGGIPIRLAIGIFWTVLVHYIPTIYLDAYIFSLMACWIGFTIPEIAMVRQMSKELPMTVQIEP